MHIRTQDGCKASDHKLLFENILKFNNRSLLLQKSRYNYGQNSKIIKGYKGKSRSLPVWFLILPIPLLREIYTAFILLWKGMLLLSKANPSNCALNLTPTVLSFHPLLNHSHQHTNMPDMPSLYQKIIPPQPHSFFFTTKTPQNTFL